MTKSSCHFWLTFLVCVALSLTLTADVFADTPTSPYLTLAEAILPDPIDIVEVNAAGDRLWAVHYSKLKTSVDYGANWTDVKTFGRGINTFRSLFVDSNENLFIGRLDLGLLMKITTAAGDTVACTDVLSYDCVACDSADNCFSFWHMSEDSSGNLFFGEYNGAAADTCAVVWKSTDDGDNWTRIRWAQDDRHVHFAAVDPANDRLYISIGDATGYQFLDTSDDAGANWTTIYSADCWAQPVSWAFGSAGTIFGSDCGSAGGGNGIYRTTNDSDFIAALTLTGAEDNYVWSMATHASDLIVAGTVGHDEGADSNDVRLYASYNGGRSWYTIKDLPDADDNDGVQWISQRTDDQGYSYYTIIEEDGDGVDTYRFKLTYTPQVGAESGHRRTSSRRRR